MRDYLEVYLLRIVLKLRWWYFHLCPWYCKFSVEGNEYHFQNTRTGVIHSQIIINFNEDSPFYKGDEK